MAKRPKQGDTPPTGKPARPGRAINVWVSDAHGASLDAFIEKNRNLPKITGIIELALEEFFRREGCWLGEPETPATSPKKKP